MLKEATELNHWSTEQQRKEFHLEAPLKPREASEVFKVLTKTPTTTEVYTLKHDPSKVKGKDLLTQMKAEQSVASRPALKEVLPEVPQREGEWWRWDTQTAQWGGLEKE